MKKMILLCILLVPFFDAYSSSRIEIGIGRLKGKVKSVSIAEYKAKIIDGKIVVGDMYGFGLKTVKKSITGEIIEKTINEPDGSMYTKDIYYRNENGILEKIVGYYLGKEFSVQNCDEYGNVITEYIQGRLASTNEYRYNSEGIVVFKKDNSGTYIYDEKGREIEMNNFGNILYQRYDSRGRKKSSLYNLQNSTEYRTYKYGWRSKKFIYECVGKDGLMIEKSLDTQKFNRKRDITEKKYYKDGKLTGHIVFKYKYNRQGYITYTKRTDVVENKTNVYEFILTYDSNGNWIRSVSFENGQAKSITERIITYYE